MEFKRKRVARAVAAALNKQIMGGNRRAYYHYDAWNLKYLPGFKWHHLTDKLAYEKQSRDKRLRTEIAQVKRQNNLYLERVERARVNQKIAEKREKRAQNKAAPESTATTATATASFTTTTTTAALPSPPSTPALSTKNTTSATQKSEKKSSSGNKRAQEPTSTSTKPKKQKK